MMKLIEAKIDYVSKTLKHTNGNKARAARILGISESGLHKLCKTYKITLRVTKDSFQPRVISVKYSLPMEVK